MQRKPKMYFYDPNNKEIHGELACWCWHKEIDDPEATMTLRYFLPNGEVQIYASFGYWSWTGGETPHEITESEFIENVRKYLPNAEVPAYMN